MSLDGAGETSESERKVQKASAGGGAPPGGRVAWAIALVAALATSCTLHLWPKHVAPGFEGRDIRAEELALAVVRPESVTIEIPDDYADDFGTPPAPWPSPEAHLAGLITEALGESLELPRERWIELPDRPRIFKAQYDSPPEPNDVRLPSGAALAALKDRARYVVVIDGAKFLRGGIQAMNPVGPHGMGTTTTRHLSFHLDFVVVETATGQVVAYGHPAAFESFRFVLTKGDWLDAIETLADRLPGGVPGL